MLLKYLQQLERTQYCPYLKGKNRIPLIQSLKELKIMVKILLVFPPLSQTILMAKYEWKEEEKGLTFLLNFLA